MLAKANVKKLLVSAVLVALLCAPLVATALAAPDDVKPPAADSSAVTDDGQTLTAPAPQDNDASTSDGNPVLIQQRDANATDDSSAAATDAPAETDPSLIANNTTPDNTAAVVGAVVLALAIAVGASVAVVRLRKK